MDYVYFFFFDTGLPVGRCRGQNKPSHKPAHHAGVCNSMAIETTVDRMHAGCGCDKPTTPEYAALHAYIVRSDTTCDGGCLAESVPRRGMKVVFLDSTQMFEKHLSNGLGDFSLWLGCDVGGPRKGRTRGRQTQDEKKTIQFQSLLVHCYAT